MTDGLLCAGTWRAGDGCGESAHAGVECVELRGLDAAAMGIRQAAQHLSAGRANAVQRRL